MCVKHTHSHFTLYSVSPREVTMSQVWIEGGSILYSSLCNNVKSKCLSKSLNYNKISAKLLSALSASALHV